MNLQRIRNNIKHLNAVYDRIGYKTYIKENSVGIVIACNMHYKEEDNYFNLFALGVTTETIEYACSHAKFLLYCKIYNKDSDHIIEVAKGFLSKLNNNEVKL